MRFRLRFENDGIDNSRRGFVRWKTRLEGDRENISRISIIQYRRGSRVDRRQFPEGIDIGIFPDQREGNYYLHICIEEILKNILEFSSYSDTVIVVSNVGRVEPVWKEIVR